MSAPAAGAGAAPWSLAFLRAGLLACLPVTAVGAVVVGVLSGWAAAVSVLVSAAVVAFFFCISGAVITWAGRVGDAFTLPAAMGTFLLKMLLLAAVLHALPADGWIDRRVLGWSVVAGALLWSVVQARWVWATSLYYVTPPAPPTAAEPVAEEAGGAGAQEPLRDPETRTTRG